jgi:hypothetical protein
MRRILDRNISRYNYSVFRRTRLLGAGRAVRFTYQNGVQYDVPLAYMKLWGGELQRSVTTPRAGSLRVTRTRRGSDGYMAAIFLNDRSMFHVPWDTVLMACEPLCGHFGGLARNGFKKVARAHVHLVSKHDPRRKSLFRRSEGSSVAEHGDRA